MMRIKKNQTQQPNTTIQTMRVKNMSTGFEHEQKDDEDQEDENQG